MDRLSNKNVAWVLTRHHNLIAAVKILDREAKELEQAGLEQAATALYNYSGQIQALIYHHIETIKLCSKGTDDGQD